MADPIDSAFAGYRFHRVLGEDADAGTYEVTEQAGGREVVIETLVGARAGDEDLREWFRWAWEALAEVEHRGVVRVFDVGEREGVPYAVRESVAGDDLATTLASDGALLPEVADEIVAELAAALAELHDAGIVHGSLGPGSVLLVRSPGEQSPDPTPRLTGFGRVEGHRRDDVAGLARIHSAMLDPEESSSSPLAEVHELAEAGRYRTAPAFAEAVARARAGHAPEDELDEPEGVGTVATSTRRARRGFLLVTAAAVAAVVAVVLLTSGDDSEPEPATGPPPVAGLGPAEDDAPAPAPGVSATGDGTTPTANAGASPIDVSGGPAGVAVRDGIVYVATAGSGELVGYEEGTGEEVVGPVELGAEAAEVTIVDDVGWVTLPDANQVARVDLSVAKPAAELFAVGERPAGLTAALGSIFVADSGSGQLSRVDVGDGAGEAVIIGAQEPRGIAYGLDSLWVTDGAGRLLQVDPDNPAGSESFEVGAEPRGVLVVDDAVWVANSGDGTVTRFDPESGEGEAIDVGGEPLDVAADPTRIWVANANGYVSAIDIATNEVERIDVEADLGAPVGVAVGDEVWVTTGDGNSLVPVAEPG